MATCLPSNEPTHMWKLQLLKELVSNMSPLVFVMWDQNLQTHKHTRVCFVTASTYQTKCLEGLGKHHIAYMYSTVKT